MCLLCIPLLDGVGIVEASTLTSVLPFLSAHLLARNNLSLVLGVVHSLSSLFSYCFSVLYLGDGGSDTIIITIFVIC